ncbi:hypothetical protein KFK09_028834 [Dendrobium nobile]|uniref:Uncharacterized protein n=1 Tax=Dendrobium nobile TaxID=94219 RepID=A0A8T3A8T5_DENNO|nr:hypothetical protein KFK09_028834 [Dendrobium nobile]
MSSSFSPGGRKTRLRRVGVSKTPRASGFICCSSSHSDHVPSDFGSPLHLVKYLLCPPSFVEIISSLGIMSTFSAIGILGIILGVEVGFGVLTRWGHTRLNLNWIWWVNSGPSKSTKSFMLENE